MVIFFEVCFFCGVGLTIALVVLGGLLDAFDMDGIDFSVDFLGLSMALPSPVMLLIFLAAFGGTGMILMSTSENWPIAVYIGISALVGGSLAEGVNQFIMKPLRKAQNTSTPEEEELIGLPAIVTEGITKGGFGEISYTVNGNSYMAPAKEADGKELKKGTEVAICWIKDYVFYVAKLDEGGN